MIALFTFKKSVALAVYLFFLTSCTNTTLYRTVTSKRADGSTVARAVPMLKIAADINGPATITSAPDGTTTIDIKPIGESIAFARRAVVDGKGNPILDKNGNPIYNDVPVIAGINHSAPLAVWWEGLSKATRSAGSVAGTIAASVAGAEAANEIGGAINAAVSP